MVREQRRLLISRPRLEAAAGGGFALTAEESRYLTKVLRHGPGDGFAVVDGQGSLWRAVLTGASTAELLSGLGQPDGHQPPPQPALVLAVAVVKRDFDLVVRMAVELGVDRLIPLLCERTAVQGQPRPERWRSIAAEAAEQCERLWLPAIDDPQPLASLLDGGAPSGALRLWATTRQAQVPPLADVLDQRLDPAPAAVWLACGPEGGWSPAEEQLAQGGGWRPVQLGPTILRSSTAAVAAVAGLADWRWRRCGC